MAIFFTSSCLALEANELLVVANRNAQDSVGLAKDYMKKRGVPIENLLKLFVADKERVSREDYEQKIASRIREKLADYPLSIRPRCILLIKGVPLKIVKVPLTAAEKTGIGQLRGERKQLLEQLNALTDDTQKKKIESGLTIVKKKIQTFNWNHHTSASVDSELMLVRADGYPLQGWVTNPFFLGFKNQKSQLSKNDVVMVSRLDAPDEQIVQRMIDDAIYAEKVGLTGTAYFDAKRKDPGDKKVSGYGMYDKSIHLAAGRIGQSDRMPVVLEDSGKLFQPGECPQAALYCGWYSYNKYIDAFHWVKGAIGYHIASVECHTLRPGKSQAWCKRMLEEGGLSQLDLWMNHSFKHFRCQISFLGYWLKGN